MGVGGRGEGVGWIFGGKEEFRLGLDGGVGFGGTCDDWFGWRVGLGWGSLRGLVLAGYGGLGMVNMNVGWLTDGWMDGWMDGWIDDSPATPHRALGPARSMYQRTFRALDLPFLFFHFFLPGSQTRSP